MATTNSNYLERPHTKRFKNCKGQLMVNAEKSNEKIDDNAFVYWSPTAKTWFADKNMQMIDVEEYRQMLRDKSIVSINK